jgi:hypothetical protein
MDRLSAPDAREAARALLAMTSAEFSEELKATPLSRARLPGLRRNACAVLGNGGRAADVPTLAAAIADDEPMVRLAAVESLGRPSAVSGAGRRRARQAFDCTHPQRNGGGSVCHTCYAGLVFIRGGWRSCFRSIQLLSSRAHKGPSPFVGV